MNGTSNGSQEPGGVGPGGSKSTPIAAIAGAIVLAGLVAYAIYHLVAAPAGPVGGAPEADGSAPADALPAGGGRAAGGAEAPAPGTDAAAKGNPVKSEVAGTPIVAQAPIRLSPEANILAERYRCVCGCNDPLGLCNCRLARGSEEMRNYEKELADQHLLPEEADRAMTQKLGAAALLKTPAPPQTQPSHVAGTPKKKAR